MSCPVLCYDASGTKSVWSPTTWAETKWVTVNETGNYPGPLLLSPPRATPGRPTTVDPLCAQSSRLTLPYGRALRLPASSFWLLSQFVSTVAVLSGPPCAAFMRYLLIDTSSDNGCRLKRAENFSWSGMSSAVRRLTQGAWLRTLTRRLSNARQVTMTTSLAFCANTGVSLIDLPRTKPIDDPQASRQATVCSGTSAPTPCSTTQ